MADATTYPAGIPIWVDLGTPDIDASVAFYGAVLGWTAQPGAPEAGGYRICELNGLPVAGIGPIFNPNQPTAWTQYVKSIDADATALAVKAAGGQVLFEPMDVMGQGKMGVFMDVTGAAFGVWQPMAFAGAGVFNAPGAFGWSEIYTRDIEGAKAFYKAVFGWDNKTDQMPGMGEYVLWMHDGREFGGAMDMPPMLPESAPPYWLIYFGVADIDAAYARATALGAQTYVGVMDVGPGRMAIIADPHGAAFAIIQMKPEA